MTCAFGAESPAATTEEDSAILQRILMDVSTHHAESIARRSLFSAREFSASIGYAGELVDPYDSNRFRAGHGVVRANYWHLPQVGGFVEGLLDHDGTRAFDGIGVGGLLGWPFKYVRPYLGAKVEWLAYDEAKNGDKTDVQALLGADIRWRKHTEIKIELSKSVDELDDLRDGFGVFAAIGFRF